VELSFLKNCKNCIQKWILQVIFSRRCSNCPKNKIVHNFLIKIKMEWIKTFHVDKNIIYENEKFKKRISKLFCHPLSLVLSLFGHNLGFWAPIGKTNCISIKLIGFSILKKFQKIMTKLQPVDTCPKSHLSLEGTMVL